MTNLSWIERRKYKPFFSKNIRGCELSFWTDYNKGCVKKLVGREGVLNIVWVMFREGGFGYKFRDIDIIFMHKSTIKDFEKETLAQTPTLTLGHVTFQDMDQRRNIISLNLADIRVNELGQTLSKLAEGLKASGFSEPEIARAVESRKNDVVRITNSNFLRTLYRTLVHELTHLWHYKVNDAIAIRQRNHRRFERISGGRKKEDIAFEKMMNLDFSSKDLREFKDILVRFYVLVRKGIVTIRDLFCTEDINYSP